MLYLRHEYWDRFLKGSVRDGRYFEDLVARLLEKIEGGHWIRTPHSWDRGRDFIRSDRRSVAAEAKNQSAPLSIRSLSPTLVMAVADNLSEVIFFSFSRINVNALEHLAAFEEQTKIKMRAFHDESLEEVILRYPTILREFFPKYRDRRRFKRGRIEITARLTRDPENRVPDIGISGDLFDGDSDTVAINGQISTLETFAMDFFVFNRSVRQDSDFSIQLLPDSIHRNFELLDKEVEDRDFRLDFTLSPGEVTRRRVHFRPFAAGVMVDLPHWKANSKGLPTKCRTLPDKVTIAAIFRSPLVGSKYVSALTSFDRRISFRDKPVFEVVYGKSGCGKTRILSELRNVLYRRGFELVRIRGEHAQMTKFDEFFQRYLSIRYCLPRKAPDEVDEELDAPWREKSDGRGLVDRLLYDPEWRPSNHPQECQNAFLGSLAGHKVAIVIDDIQGLDPSTIQFLNRLTTVLLESNHRLALVLSFNTDLVAKDSPANSYLRRLVDLAAVYEQQVSCIELNGFSLNEAREFLNNCLRSNQNDLGTSFTITYSSITDLFLERVELVPLFLEQALLYLEQKNCIMRDKIGFYVEDHKRLKGEIGDLESVPSTRRLETLLSRRYAAFENTLSAEQWIVIELLCWLIHIPSNAFGTLGISPEDVQALMRLGVVDYIGGHAIEFHHQTLLRLIRGRRRPGQETFERLDRLFGEQRWQDRYFPQFCLRRSEGGPMSRILFRKLLERMQVGRIENEYLMPLLDVVLLELDAVLSWFDPGWVIDVLDDVAHRLRPRLGYELARSVYQRIYDQILLRRRKIRYGGRSFYKFVVRYGSVLLALRKDERAMAVLQTSLDMIDDFDFRLAKYREEAIGLVANRLCAALLGHRRESAALDIGRMASEAAQRGRCAYIAFQQRIDNGYVFYGFRSGNPALLKEWKAAIEMFDESFLPEHELITNRAVAKLHEIHVAMLEGRLKEGLALIERERWVCQENLDPFHEVKMVLLNVVAFLIRGEQIVTAERTLDAISHAKDLASRFDLGQVYWVCFHASAKFWQYNDHFDQAVVEFHHALAQISSVLANQEMEDRYDWFFDDYAISLRTLGAEVNSTHLSMIKRGTRRRRAHRIVTMSSKDFEEFLENYQPKATYFRSSDNLPCP